MAIWDMNTGQSIRTSPKIHGGAVSKIIFFSDGGSNNVIISAG